MIKSFNKKQKIKYYLTYLVVFAFFLNPVFLFAQNGGIVVDKNHTQNIQVLPGQNGVPQVNINAPNAKGLSHNKFQQFEVNKEGVILNNSHENVKTQLGGFVEGNPNLIKGKAKVILNEVNSTKPTNLKGFIEVAGDKADVIIANPKGINVDGSGFINANSATLTTGQVEIENGQLSGFKVTEGHIEINGLGLNNKQSDYTNIISQSAAVNAGIWANKLYVTTGSNQVSADNQNIKSLNKNNTKVSLDVSQLGGMYAGYITLVGTSEGLGVRNKGEIVAQVGQLILTTDGRVENRGLISAQQNLKINAQEGLENFKDIQSESSIELNSPRQIENKGNILANNNINIKTDTNLITSGNIKAQNKINVQAKNKVDNSGEILAGELSIETDKLINTGDIEAVNKLNLQTKDDFENTRDLISKNIVLSAKNLTNTANFKASESLEITLTGNLDNRGDLIAKVILLNANNLINNGEIYSGEKAVLNLIQSIENFNNIIANNLTVLSNSLINSGHMLATNSLNLKVAEDVENSGHLMAKDLFLQAKNLTNSGNIKATDNLKLLIENKLTNQNAAEIIALNVLVNATTLNNYGIFDGGEVVLKAKDIKNQKTGTIFADFLALEAVNITNGVVLGTSVGSSGLIAGRESLNIAVSGNFTNREDGLVFSGGDIHFGGTLKADNKVTGSGGTILNSSAIVEALGSIYITANNFINENAHYATQLRVTNEELFEGYRFTEYRPDHIFLVGDDALQWHGGAKEKAKVIDADGNIIYSFVNFFKYNYKRTTEKTFVTESRPGFLIAGDNIVVDANFTNNKSQVSAGNTLQMVGGTFNNIAAIGEIIVTDLGSFVWAWHKWEGGLGGSGNTREYGAEQAYKPAPSISKFELDVLMGASNPNYGGAPLQLTVDNSKAHIELDANGNNVTLNLEAYFENLNLNNNLFTINTSPTSKYVLETNPRLTNYRQWLSSDFILKRLNANPSIIHKRLGDGFYEQGLLREQIANLTGERLLSGYSNDEEQYMALMLAGVEFAEEFELTLGVKLSAEMMANLTSDIVWLEEVSINTADGPIKALAPKVYLAPGRASLINPQGTLVSAKVIDINLDSTINNQGTVYASLLVNIEGENINNEGVLAGKLVNIKALNNIDNIGGIVIAEDLLQLTAGNNINIESQTLTTNTQGLQYYGEQTNISKIASIEVKNKDSQLLMEAGNDINLKAANIETQGEAFISAGNNLNISTVKTGTEYKAWASEKNSAYDKKTEDVASLILTEGNLVLSAKNNINIKGSQVEAKENLLAQIGNDINISEGRYTSEYDLNVYTKSSGLFSKKSTEIHSSGTKDYALGSDISGQNVNIITGNDFNLKGSTVAASDGLSVFSVGNINIETAQNSETSYHQEIKKSKGFSQAFSGGGFGVQYGKKETGEENINKEFWHSASLIGSENGTVNLMAEKDLTIKASQVIAGTGDINLSGENVLIGSEYNLSENEYKYYKKESGFSIGLGLAGQVGQTLDAAIGLARQGKDIEGSNSDRAKALYGIAAARSAYDFANQGLPLGEEILANGLNANMVGVSAKLSFGSSKEERGNQSSQTTALGSHISSGSNINIVGHGAENGLGGDITIVGSYIEAEDKVSLIAKNNLNILSAQEISFYDDYERSSGSSFGASVGLGNSGFGVSVDASGHSTKAMGKGEHLNYLESIIKGGQGVEFVSVNDTYIKGGQIFGETISGLVGGNLTIISEQDTSKEKREKKTESGGFSVPLTGGGEASLSFNQTKQNAKANYLSVNEQSGIFAGSGGFNITVGEHTKLVGAVIEGSPKGHKNYLETGTLSYEDLENVATYEAKTSGSGLSLSSGGQAMVAPTLPMEEDGQKQSLTKSAVSEATIVITKAQEQLAKTGQTIEEALAGLSRNTEDAHQGPLAKNPNLQEILDKQDEINKASQQAGKAIAQTIGDVAKHYTDEYENHLMGKEKLEGLLNDSDISEEQKTALLEKLEEVNNYLSNPENIATYKNWSEGGINKIIAQAIGAGLVAQIGNSGGLEAALGAVANQLTASEITKLANILTSGIEDQEARILLNNIIKNIGSTAVGGVVGGETGAGSAAVMDAYNRQLHPSEREWIEKNADDLIKELASLGFEDVTKQEALELLTQEALKKIDAWWYVVLTPEYLFDESLLTEKQKEIFENYVLSDKEKNAIIKMAAANAFLDAAQGSFSTGSGIYDRGNQGLFTVLGGQFNDNNFLLDLYRGGSDNPNLEFYKKYAHSGIVGDNSLYNKGLNDVTDKVLTTFNYLKQEKQGIFTVIGEGLGDSLFDFKQDPYDTFLNFSLDSGEWAIGLSRDVKYQFSYDSRKFLNEVYNDTTAEKLQATLAVGKADLALIGFVTSIAGKGVNKAVKSVYNEAYKKTAKALKKPAIGSEFTDRVSSIKVKPEVQKLYDEVELNKHLSNLDKTKNFEKDYVKIEGRGSTGRTEPKNLREELAMEAVRRDPFNKDFGDNARDSVEVLSDARWKGWEKKEVVFRSDKGENIVIHFNYNTTTKQFDDFKFKDYEQKKRK